MKTVLFTLILTALASSAFAMENSKTICTNSDLQRVIEVIYTGEEGEMPCEVRYTKASEIETPWSAQTEIGYCMGKATELITKHQGWGWACAEVVNP